MSLKRINPTSISKICSSQDPAIDTTATGEENLEKYSEKYDMSLLTFLADQKPTIFHIKNILPVDEAEIQENHYIVEMPDTSKMKAKDVKNARPTVKQVKQQQMFMKYFEAGVQCIEDNGIVETTVNVNEWPLTIQQEIGGYIMLRTTLGEEEKKS